MNTSAAYELVAQADLWCLWVCCGFEAALWVLFLPCQYPELSTKWYWQILVWQLQGNSIEPPSRETDAINMHDAMWVEIRRAVAEARNELEQVRADYLFFSIPSIKRFRFSDGMFTTCSWWTQLLQLGFFCQSVSGCSPHQLCLAESCHQPCLWFWTTYIACPNSLLAKTLWPKVYMQFQMMYGRNMWPSLSRFVWNCTHIEC